MSVLIISVFAFLSLFFAIYLWDTILKERITVKLITNTKDKDIEKLIVLYIKNFSKDESNYSSDDIINLIDGQSKEPKNKHPGVEDFIHIAKQRGNVVGFIFCHFYPDRSKAFISYYATDKSIMHSQDAAHALLKKSLAYLRSNKRQCEYIFFDVYRPHQGLNRSENIKRKARITVLKQSAASFGLKAYCLKFDYVSPKVTLSDDAEEAQLTLMFIPLINSFKDSIQKKLVIEFLKFVYLECYGDMCYIKDSQYSAYQAYLNERLLDFENMLPNEVGFT